MAAEWQEKTKSNPVKSLALWIKLFFNAVWLKKMAKNAFFQNKKISCLIALNIFANIANWIMLAVFIQPVDGNIILHYNVYFGVDIMGNWKQVFLIPTVGLILFLTNIFFAAYFYKNKERVASYVLLIAVLMAQFNLIVASLSAIVINY